MLDKVLPPTPNSVWIVYIGVGVRGWAEFSVTIYIFK